MKNHNISLKGLPFLQVSQWRELADVGKIRLKFVKPNSYTTQIPVAFYKGYMAWRPAYTKAVIKRVSMHLWMEAND